MTRGAGRLLAGVALLAGLLLLWWGRGGAEDGARGAAYRTVAGEAMATPVAVTLPEGPEAAAAGEAVLALFHRLDAMMSEWKEGSPLAAVNRGAGGDPVPVPPELLALIRRSLDLAAATGGAFDPSWAALWGLWDFRDPAPSVPSAEAVARQAALVGWREVEVDEAAGTVRLPRPGMQLGLGAIAKGYAQDRAAALLRGRGVTSFLLDAGGQVYAAGRKGDRPWRIGIRDPRGPRDDYFARLELGDASASTSGDYERFFVVDGVRYHHVLDPRTGWPARGLRSATVIAADATLADALSTAVMVLGPEAGLALVERTPGVEAVVVDAAGKVASTPGIGDRLVVRHPPAPGPR